jgi:hypothetical protein
VRGLGEFREMQFPKINDIGLPKLYIKFSHANMSINISRVKVRIQWYKVSEHVKVTIGFTFYQNSLQCFTLLPVNDE